MNSLTAAAMVFAMLPGVSPPATKAEPESYVKVEIKGRLQVEDPSRPGLYHVAVSVQDEFYYLDLKGAKAKLPSEKELKKLNQELVVVHGHLIRDTSGRIESIMVTKFTFVAKPAQLKSP